MVSTPCEVCGRPVGDASVCARCGQDVERKLGNVPAVAFQLHLVITRQTRYVTQTDGSRATETPVPFHVKAGEARDVLRNVLVGWTRLYAEEAKADLPVDSLSAMSAFLLSRVEWFRHHVLAAEFVDEVLAATITAERLIDSPPNRATFPVGPCPENPDGMACPGEVRAYIPAAEGVARLECSVCATQWGSWQWLSAGKRILAKRAETLGA